MKKCIGGHAEDAQCVHCTMDPVRTGNGVPRNSRGWPLVTLEEMTDDQLRREANRWRLTAIDTYPTITVSVAEWNKYAGEYARRGLATLDQVDNFEELQCAHLWVGWTNIEVCELCEVCRVIPPDPEDQVSKRSWWKWWKR